MLSCTRADIMYVQVPVVEGSVQIYPDMSKHTLPAMKYHFYNTDTDQEYIVRSCDGIGNFDATLPVGTYRVIATNTSASNVEFTGMNSHETAIVKAHSQNSRLFISRSGNYTMLLQPDNVYSTIVEELVVTENNTVRLTPVPTLLTKQLNLVFSMQSGLDTEVASMTGVLPGIYPAVHLYTCEGTQIEQSPEMAVNFETVAEGNERKAQISLFGVCDPATVDYTNNLELELTMKDGSTSNVTLDLTEVISDIMEKNEGSIPPELSIPIEVTKTETDDIKVGVEVGGWIEEGEGEKEEDT